MHDETNTFYADVETDRLDQLLLDQQFAELEKRCTDILDSAEAPLDRKLHAMTVLAQRCLDRGSIEECKAIIDAVLKMQTNFWRAWYIHGLAALFENNIHEAKQHFEQCLRYHQNSDLALSGLGTCLVRMGDRSAAKLTFQRALRVNRSCGSALQGLVYVSNPREDFQELEKVIKEYLLLKPLDTGVRIFLARLYRDSGFQGEAYAECVKVLLVNPDDTEANLLKTELGAEK